MQRAWECCVFPACSTLWASKAKACRSQKLKSIMFTLVDRDIAHTEYPFLKAGDRVRIRGGALNGLEGFLVKCPGQNKLVVSLSLIQRSLAVALEGYDVEKI